MIVPTDFSVCFRTLTLASTVCRQACKSNYDNCHYMLFTNKIGVIADLLILRLTVSYCIEMFIKGKFIYSYILCISTYRNNTVKSTVLLKAYI